MLQKIHKLILPIAAITNLASAFLLAKATDVAYGEPSVFASWRAVGLILLMLSLLLWAVYALLGVVAGPRKAGTKKK